MLFDILGASKKNDRLYLFKDGDQCSDVTGGWVNYVEGNGGSYTADIRENSLYVGGTGNGKKGWKPKNNISPELLNRYDYIFFEYKGASYNETNGGYCEFYAEPNSAISSIRDSNLLNRYVKRILAVPLKTTAFRFGIQMNGNSTSYMWVSKVWLEKVGA